MRGVESRIELDPGFSAAAAPLQAGQHLWIVTHLHQVRTWDERQMAELFQRRLPSRPNPISITLVRVVAVEGATLTVAGLDAIDGTPVLDVKPYKPVYDQPPVTPQIETGLVGASASADGESRRPMIALTGGPGGGKSTLIDDLSRDPAWSGRFVALPETAHTARHVLITPKVKLFQRAMVELQISLEDGLDRALGPGDRRAIICHRGSLDPVAFWRQRGWSMDEFYSFTGTRPQEHYQRYAAVIHLVTAADGVPWEYTRWPEAHRPEDAEEALQLDRWLAEGWGGHPEYHRIDNRGRDWPAKSAEARRILGRFL